MNIYKDVFFLNKKHKNMTNEEIIDNFNKVWDKRINLILKFKKEEQKASIYKLLKNKKYDEYIKLLTELKIIVPFSEELLDEMNNIQVLGKSLKEHYNDYTTRGNCFSMSVALSMIFKNEFVLNRGIINLPLISVDHQWLEYDNKVYDTTFHLIFPKEYYYDIYSPNNVHRLTTDEIENIKNDIFNGIKKNSVHR